MEAPKGTSISVPIGPKTAQELAYYKSALGAAVLAPRGWYCLGDYGSDGHTLVASPKPIDSANAFSTGLTGPQLKSPIFGDTSGRFEVAEVIARSFPAYKALARGVMEAFDLPASFYAFSPYPEDTITYKGERAVEFKTPAQVDGLGTHRWMRKNGSPIVGVAILIGQTPDLLLLSVRLPAGLTGLGATIVRQVEQNDWSAAGDAAGLPK
jgi:hypothetical protein